MLPRENDIKAHTAIAMAKSAYGFDSVKWIDSSAGVLFEETGTETGTAYLGHYVYYIVGEKDGEQACMAIPSDPDKYKPFALTWRLSHSFSRVVDKFNECGANYTAEVGYDYYNSTRGCYIDFEVHRQTIEAFADYFDVGCDGKTFYARLDVPGVFYYTWTDGENVNSCIVTQEGGELKAYKTVSANT